MVSEIQEACYSGHLVQPFVEVLRGHPKFPDAILRELTDKGMQTRIPIGIAHEMLRAAVEMTADQDLGLKAAQTIGNGHFETLEYAAAAAVTWGDAIAAMVKLAPLLNEAAQFRLEVEGARATLLLASRVPLSRVAGDFCTAGLWTSVRGWDSELHHGGEVWFAHPRPNDISAYTRLFGAARLVFDAPDYAIVFDSSMLLRPNVRAEPPLYRILMAYGERLLEDLPKSESLSERVRRAIVETMPDGTVSAERVAAMLCMSRRTLSRQLGAEDTSFRALLEDVRQRFAKHYLESTNHGASDIAFLLGFSQSAAFVRAFRRWTGFAPGEYRRRLRP